MVSGKAAFSNYPQEAVITTRAGYDPASTGEAPQAAALIKLQGTLRAYLSIAPGLFNADYSPS